MISRRACSWVVGLALLCLAVGAWGQKSKKPSSGDREKAKTLFKQAESHYKIQEYEEALSGYKEAYLLSQEPLLLYNIGQCYRQLGRYAEALKSYKTFLSEAPATSPFRTEAEGFLADLEPLVAKAREVEEAQPTSSAALPSSPAASEPVAEPLPEEPGEAPKSPAKLLYGVAAAAAGLGFVSGGLGLSAGRQSAELSLIEAGGQADTEEIARLFQRGKTLTLAADALVGAGLLVGGVGFILGQRAKKAGDAGASLSFSPGGAALSVRF